MMREFKEFEVIKGGRGVALFLSFGLGVGGVNFERKMTKMDNTAKVGTSTTLVSYGVGRIMFKFETGQEEVLFWMQITAFAISILVGILTAIYYFRLIRKKSKIPRDGKEKV